MSRPTPLSRRGLLGGGLAALALTGLSGCADDSTPTPVDGAADVPSGPWSWTDDLGQEIELERAPTRIAAYGDAAAALMNFGITPVALFHYIPPADDPTFEDLDLSDVAIIGEAYGELNLEQLAAAAPELIVTTSYAGEKPELMYGFKGETQMEKVRQIAPVIGVMQSGSALDVIRANEKLVASLGVDVDSGQVAEDRAAFEEASAELTAPAQSGLTLLPLYAEEAGGIWFAKAPDDPALNYYQSLGVQFADVGGKDYYWHNVGWENADLYPADVVLYSMRGSLTPEQMMEQPTFARLPVAEAGQLHPWKFKSMDYPSQTSYLRELAGWLTEDRDVA